MNIDISVPCSDTASSRIPETWEKIIINAVGISLRDITVSLSVRINTPDTPDAPINFEPLADPPNDCMIDPWGEDYQDPWEPWPQFYVDGSESEEEAI